MSTSPMLVNFIKQHPFFLTRYLLAMTKGLCSRSKYVLSILHGVIWQYVAVEARNAALLQQVVIILGDSNTAIATS